jgi:hypothetical protein
VVPRAHREQRGQVLQVVPRALVEFRAVHRVLVALRGQVVREEQMVLVAYRELVVILRVQQAEHRGQVAQVVLREHRELVAPRGQVDQVVLVEVVEARALTEETEHRAEVVRRALVV